MLLINFVIIAPLVLYVLAASRFRITFVQLCSILKHARIDAGAMMLNLRYNSLFKPLVIHELHMIHAERNKIVFIPWWKVQ